MKFSSDKLSTLRARNLEIRDYILNVRLSKVRCSRDHSCSNNTTAVYALQLTVNSQISPLLHD